MSEWRIFNIPFDSTGADRWAARVPGVGTFHLKSNAADKGKDGKSHTPFYTLRWSRPIEEELEPVPIIDGYDPDGMAVYAERYVKQIADEKNYWNNLPRALAELKREPVYSEEDLRLPFNFTHHRERLLVTPHESGYRILVQTYWADGGPQNSAATVGLLPADALDLSRRLAVWAEEKMSDG